MAVFSKDAVACTRAVGESNPRRMYESHRQLDDMVKRKDP
jgi:hypothetical protein